MTKSNKEELKSHPWNGVYFNSTFFLEELDCVLEMHELVAPVIKEKDKEREKRIEDLSELVDDPDNEGKKIRHIKSGNGIYEFLEHVKKMRRADRVYRANVITSIVSKFDEFFVSLLIETFKVYPDWLKNNEKKLTYKEVLEIESLNDFKEELILKEVNSLMRDSHYSQIDFLDKKLSLGIQESFPQWTDFLEITERRNIFTHNGGKVNEIYIDNCKKYKVPLDKNVSLNVLLSARDEYINNAIEVFYELSIRLSQAVWRRMFPESLEEADDRLNSIGYSLLINQRWQLAEKVFLFALNIPEKLRSKSEMHYYHILNLCIALKEQGKDFSTILKRIDWSPFHPKFHFAISALNGEHGKTLELMKLDAVNESVAEDGFRTWPILKHFRETLEFKEAYKEIYSKDFEQELISETERELRSQHDEGDNC